MYDWEGLLDGDAGCFGSLARWVRPLGLPVNLQSEPGFLWRFAAAKMFFNRRLRVRSFVPVAFECLLQCYLAIPCHLTISPASRTTDAAPGNCGRGYPLSRLSSWVLATSFPAAPVCA